MPSKDVMDRIRMAQGLTAIIEQLTEPLAEGMAEHLSRHLRTGEAMPDLELIQQLMGRLAMARLQALITADEFYRQALMELDDDFNQPDFDDFDLDEE